MLLASATLFVAAAAQRWWPACPRGSFDSEECLRLQDHQFDYLVPSDPWTPVGNAAQYAGVAMLLLAGAAAVLPFLLMRTHWSRVPIAVVVAAAVAVPGAQTWASGVAGSAQPAWAGLAAGLVWGVGVPALLIAWMVTRGRPDRPRTVWTTALAGALIASTPVPAWLLGLMVAGYVSHDTAPWSEAGIAVPLVVAGVLVWKVSPRPRPEIADAHARPAADPVEVGAGRAR
ncbi:hypothetical protein [Cellulomonas phragmiteti]|uniref:DUF2029 domain-containing protein n=1 Tax=Cellulomonas phragmiteti TaxID=478780 RepID=A0ABQ4DIB9_9CELL|nr:hypothetical protein [Cellulomonas phragmiteti]GIG38752.1 hypothetical protein Cph01nite_05140 [Cellulomonas phragmiteti]